MQTERIAHHAVTHLCVCGSSDKVQCQGDADARAAKGLAQHARGNPHEQAHQVHVRQKLEVRAHVHGWYVAKGPRRRPGGTLLLLTRVLLVRERFLRGA